MGGVKTDLRGRTNVEGLYCCGEAACTGVHGANRLASNSTLECLVFGRRCAETIAQQRMETPAHEGLPVSEITREIDVDAEETIIELKGIMVKYCGILRNGDELNFGLSRVKEILRKLRHARLNTTREMELYNMASVAEKILKSAVKRRVSIGSHYRIDGEEPKHD